MYNPIMNPLHATDAYKLNGHVFQYPKGLTELYANLTPRSVTTRMMSPEYDQRVVVFGIQTALKKLSNLWRTGFFEMPWPGLSTDYRYRVAGIMGGDPVKVNDNHIRDLHQLGYLPLRIKALPEGCAVPIGTPIMTVRNTHESFAWLVTYIETMLLAEIWKSCTGATIAREFHRTLSRFATETGSPHEFVAYQAHDFSCRGMSNLEDAASVGAAHLLYFKGTDTVPACDHLREYYDTNLDFHKEVGVSVPASEHSVMQAWGKDNEKACVENLISKLYPTGIVSVVADTWDFFHFLDSYVRDLKQVILDRHNNGPEGAPNKVVIRPDSGDILDVLLGHRRKNPAMRSSHAEHIGALELLWSIFGGTKNRKGYRVLHPSVGLIWGDSITPRSAEHALREMRRAGWASENLVLGVGSSSYNRLHRDDFGFAYKTTSAVIDGERVELLKKPKHAKYKESHCGLLRVSQGPTGYEFTDRVSETAEDTGELKEVFLDGELRGVCNIHAVRGRAYADACRG